MVKAVFTHADGSRYDDLPESRYHFPSQYLNVARESIGDHIVYYEPRRTEGRQTGGRQAYFATARLRAIVPDPVLDGLFYGLMSDYIAFPNSVPFRQGDLYLESKIKRPDGGTSKGAFGRAIRSIPDTEFSIILNAGFAGVRDDLGAEDWQGDTRDEFDDAATPFERPILERIERRAFRDAAFAQQVKAAYTKTCAMTGLRIINGGGRPEVQAAHIRPVHQDGPDTIRNGIALSSTMHWMFDRGLVSIGNDHSILVAEKLVPDMVKRMLTPDRKLILPEPAFLHPHPAYLSYHRESFKG